jgi:hypothetical protein
LSENKIIRSLLFKKAFAVFLKEDNQFERISENRPFAHFLKIINEHLFRYYVYDIMGFPGSRVPNES